MISHDFQQKSHPEIGFKGAVNFLWLHFLVPTGRTPESNRHGTAARMYKNAGKIDLEVVDLPAQIGEKDWVGRLWWLDSRAESYAGMGLEFNLCGSFGCEGRVPRSDLPNGWSCIFFFVSVNAGPQKESIVSKPPLSRPGMPGLFFPGNVCSVFRCDVTSLQVEIMPNNASLHLFFPFFWGYSIPSSMYFGGWLNKYTHMFDVKWPLCHDAVVLLPFQIKNWMWAVGSRILVLTSLIHLQVFSPPATMIPSFGMLFSCIFEWINPKDAPKHISAFVGDYHVYFCFSTHQKHCDYFLGSDPKTYRICEGRERESFGRTCSPLNGLVLLGAMPLGINLFGKGHTQEAQQESGGKVEEVYLRQSCWITKRFRLQNARFKTVLNKRQ